LFVVTSKVGTRWHNALSRLGPAARARDSGVFNRIAHARHALQGGLRRARAPVHRPSSTDPSLAAQPTGGTPFATISRSTPRSSATSGARQARLVLGAATAELDGVAREAGFASTCTLRAQPNTRATLVGDSVLPFEISRYTITARTSLRVFRAILEGTYRPSA
jgi:hypothetical protein